MDKQKEEAIVNHFFSSDAFRVLACKDCKEKYIQFKDGSTFKFKEVKPILQKIMKNKLLKSNKGIRDILKS